MLIQILTLFPEWFSGPLQTSIVKRACEKGKVSIELKNIRDYAENKHGQCDDYPYGGGAGMVIKADVAANALNSCRRDDSHVIYVSPQGKRFKQKKAAMLAAKPHIIIICGHYEGLDERVVEQVDEEISIGDYILTGGEAAALVIIDAVVRLLPGVLGQPESAIEETFTRSLLEYPQYTRPQVHEGKEVPEVLLSGHHEQIRLWRLRQQLLRTLLKRPDLLLQREYTAEEKGLLMELLFSREQPRE